MCVKHRFSQFPGFGRSLASVILYTNLGFEIPYRNLVLVNWEEMPEGPSCLRMVRLLIITNELTLEKRLNPQIIAEGNTSIFSVTIVNIFRTYGNFGFAPKWEGVRGGSQKLQSSLTHSLPTDLYYDC